MKKSKILASFLKEKRVNSGLSQRDVADQLGYTTAQFISNWERGISNPPINALKKLGELYKVSMEELYEVTLNSSIDEVTNDLRRKLLGKKTS